MILKEMLGINKDEVISVVGAGGKTSFINYFTKAHRETNKVLLTTTTKIYRPDSSQYDNIKMTELDNKKSLMNNYKYIKNGVTVVGKFINEENKIIGLDFEEIELIKKQFDFTLIEADGSKKKKLKGWKNHEPVIHPKTHKTIGIVDITSVNMKINPKNIHNINEFIKIASVNKDSIVNIYHLKNMVLHKDGLFKNSLGKKILFINKVEKEKYEYLAKDLINLIKKESLDIEIYYGSILKEYYEVG
ncbi:MAG: selenium cofactor biosynthesis protein YqeC [Peptostreptococcaceae bacterium]